MLNHYHEKKGAHAEGHVRGHNIVLIGLTGTGKSSIGKILALKMGLGFVDTDRMIEERAGKTVAQIFASQGEEQFRELERHVIQDLRRIRNHVVVAGGGAVLDPENFSLINELGSVVWVRASPNEMARRILMNPDEIRSRPLLADLVAVEDKDERRLRLAERFQTLLLQRKDQYGRAHVTLEHNFSTPEISASLLMSKLERQSVVGRE